jgi:hypothetical protein
MKDLLMDNQSGGFVAGFLHFVLKVCLALIAMVFAACLLAVGLLAVVFTLIKALVTWQKPTPWVVFRRVQKYSSNRQWRGNQGSHREMDGSMMGAGGDFSLKDRQVARNLDVVDVEVREVTPDDVKR